MSEFCPGMRVRFARHPRNAYGALTDHVDYDVSQLKDVFILGERYPYIRYKSDDWIAFGVFEEKIGDRFWSWVRSDDIEPAP